MNAVTNYFHLFYLIILFQILKPSTLAAQWEQMPGPFGGWVRQLVIHSDNLYAAVNGGGVFKSENDGISWFPVNTGLTQPFYIFSLSSEGDTLIATTRNGLWRSVDEGNSWYPSSTTGYPFASIFRYARQDGKIFAATEYGIFRSDDDGEQWIEVGQDLPYSGETVNRFAVKDNVLFVALNFAGVFWTGDYGDTWTQVGSDTLPTGTFLDIACTDQWLYVGGGTDHSIYKSDNMGESWSKVGWNGIPASNIYDYFTTYNNALYIPTFYGVFKYNTDSDSWSEVVSAPVPELVTSMVFKDEKMFAGTFAGLFFNIGYIGSSWIERDAGIPCVSPFDLAATETTIATITTYGGKLAISPNIGQNWSYTPFISPRCICANDSLLFANDGGNFMRSNDGGESWITVFTGNNIFASDCKVNGQNVYVLHGDTLLVSYNLGQDWTKRPIQYPTVKFATSKGSHVFAITIDGEVVFSPNEGMVWEVIHTIENDSFSIAYNLASLDSTVVIMSNEGAFIYNLITDDWQRFAPDWHINSLLEVNGTVVAGGAESVYKTYDKGVSLMPFDTGFDGEIFGPKNFVANKQYIFAGLDNRGIWRRPISDLVSAHETPKKQNYHIQVFPNPAYSFIDLQWALPNIDEWKIRIFDIYGKLVLEKRTTNSTIKVERHNLPAGVYFVNALAKNGTTTSGKIIFTD